MEEHQSVYTAPQTHEFTEIQSQEPIPCNRSQRFLTLVLDVIFYNIFAFFGGVVLGLLSLVTGPGILSILDGFGAYVFGICLISFYYIVQESLFGRTLGKLIVGTKVVNEQGGKPSFGQIVGRTFARFIPFEPFSFAADYRGWHDTLSHTYVISTRK
ncbi:MAG: RDD family protein [Acidobacteria bacterium]|nr:RDD family protein [Acidobacteriota bacterium]